MIPAGATHADVLTDVKGSTAPTGLYAGALPKSRHLPRRGASPRAASCAAASRQKGLYSTTSTTPASSTPTTEHREAYQPSSCRLESATSSGPPYPAPWVVGLEAFLGESPTARTPSSVAGIRLRAQRRGVVNARGRPGTYGMPEAVVHDTATPRPSRPGARGNGAGWGRSAPRPPREEPS